LTVVKENLTAKKYVDFYFHMCLSLSTSNSKERPIMTSVFDSFLKRVFEATGIRSQAELADALDINRSAITQARRKNAIPSKWLLRLFRQYGLNPDWVETGSGPVFMSAESRDASDFVRIPKVEARLCAGDGSFEVGGDITGFFSFQNTWLRTKGSPGKMVLMDIFGNSMAPEMKDGDTVLIDQDQVNILSGAVYAVGVDDTIMVKRLEKHPNTLVLLSDNKDYAPIYLKGGDAGSLRILGKVIWICRDMR
jgi:phage repressor protein C with HTH and peptisase S24 domain